MSRINIWIVLLLISVLANGILLGAGARTWFADKPEQTQQITPRVGGFQLRAFVEALPLEEREAAIARAETSRQELRGLLREIRDARRAAAEALFAEPFDPEAAAEALARARDARAEMESISEARILEIAAGLDPEARREAFTAAMTIPERRGPRGPEGRGPRPDRRPPPPPPGGG